MARKYLRGLQYTTGTNGRDVSIFMKLCYEFWAYCVNGTTSLLTVTAATNANPIVITTSTPHGLRTGQLVGVYNVAGNTAANGQWNVTVVTPTTFQLNGATGNATYGGGGVVSVPGGVPISPTSSPTGFFEGSSVLALGNDGVTSAIGNTLTAASSVPFNPTMVGKHVVVWLAGASTGISSSLNSLSLPQSTISVGSAIDFPASGTLFINTSDTDIQTVTYTGKIATTIAVGSNNAILPQATINVASTAGFPTSGTINVATTTLGAQVVTYTGITATSFTGCSGGFGTMNTGNVVDGHTFTGCSGGTGILTSNDSVSINQPSTDDSIYRIVSVPSNTQLQLVPFSGGTTDISTLKNNLTSRGSLSYRVIDVIAASQLSIASGNYFIGTMAGASNINAGQATSQFQFLLRGSSATFGTFGVVGSPNGSWSGTAFSGSGSNATLTERTTSGTIASGTTNITGFVSIFADTDYIFAHVRSGNGASGLYFVATTPLRFYSQTQDPNLLAILVGGNLLNNTAGTDSFCTSFGMVGFDGTTRSHTLITRNLLGDTGNSNTALNYTVGASLDKTPGFGKEGRVLVTEPLMSVFSTIGQFSFARAKIRPFVFTFNALPSYYLIGSSGEFIHLVNGICMPWDGSILPYPLLALGA